jgi:hypothetical protein
MGKKLSPAAKVDAAGTWRQTLPETAASKTPTTSKRHLPFACDLQVTSVLR